MERLSVAPSCGDGVANGGEIGIDCGGSCTACAGFCTGITGMPVSECQALDAPFTSAGGIGWTEQGGWFVLATP